MKSKKEKQEIIEKENKGQNRQTDENNKKIERKEKRKK